MSSQDHLELLGKAERLSEGSKEPDQWPSCEKTPREGLVFEKTRLPSIVVEPSEGSDGESGELLWPPEDFPLLEGDEPDEFPAGEEEEEEEQLEAGFSSFENDVEDLLL
ncbi:Protein LBH, partial [Ophiophagus hannah]